MLFWISNRVFALDGELKEYTIHNNVMGSDFYVTITHSDSDKADKVLSNSMTIAKNIEKQISSWIDSSETSQINLNAGIQPVKVSIELFQLIKRSLYLSKISNGLFDITYASLDNYWYFNKKMDHFPTAEEVKHAQELIDYKKVIINDNDTTVFLTDDGMRIGFGAIGKGYAANKMKEYLVTQNVFGGIVNAGGDISAWGKNQLNQYWTIAIANPENKNETLAYLEIKNESIVTSGNYERFIMHEGEKYSHIINPITGYPAKGIQSVTVLCPDAELGDALATAVFIMSANEGIKFIDGLKNVEAIIVDDSNQIFTTEKINLIHEE